MHRPPVQSRPAPGCSCQAVAQGQHSLTFLRVMQAPASPYKGYLVNDAATREAHITEADAACDALTHRQATVKHGVVFFNWLKSAHQLEALSHEQAGSASQQAPRVDPALPPSPGSLSSLDRLDHLSTAELAQVRGHGYLGCQQLQYM